MVNVEEFYGNKEFMQAEDIAAPQAFTIEAVTEQEIGAEGEDRKKKLVVSFAGSNKSLVLNRTNSESIAKLHGSETDGWKGKKIILFKSTVTTEGKFKGKPCIRVDEAPGAGAPHVDHFELGERTAERADEKFYGGRG